MGNPSGPVHYTVSGSATFFTVASPDDGTLIYSTALPYAAGGTGVAPDGQGGFVVLGSSIVTVIDAVNVPVPPLTSWSLTHFASEASPRPALYGVANTAAMNLSPAIAPGELLILHGVNLGPAAPVNGAFDAGGHLPVDLAGVEVEFNGRLAPILSVGEQQVTVAAPFELQPGDTANILVHVGDQVSNPLRVPVTTGDPQIFLALPPSDLYYPTLAAALNQDGSVNGATVAQARSIVTIFVNGAGQLTPTPQDGTKGHLGQTPVLPVSLSYSTEYDIRYGRLGAPLEVLYAGPSPGLLPGVLQINFRMPPPVGINQVWVHVAVGDQVTTGAVAAQ
jgi:uncharacterized protein (TIGR03437 family)